MVSDPVLESCDTNRGEGQQTGVGSFRLIPRTVFRAMISILLRGARGLQHTNLS